MSTNLSGKKTGYPDTRETGRRPGAGTQHPPYPAWDRPAQGPETNILTDRAEKEPWLDREKAWLYAPGHSPVNTGSKISVA